MKTQALLDYARVAQAIEYLQAHFSEKPDLDTLAGLVGLSPFHFQRLFTTWAGVSPKKFLQYIQVEFAKNLLQQQSTLSEVSVATGLSSTSRLHDLFITIEGMTPAQFKQHGKNLTIWYSFYPTNFGEVLIAATEKGICHLVFCESRISALEGLFLSFSNANFIEASIDLHEQALSFFYPTLTLPSLSLHLKGTPFQLKVWKALLSIAPGQLCSYQQLAQNIQQPKAARAIGSALAANNIAYLIPCHRVILSSGQFGNYRWGNLRKTLLLGHEIAQQHKNL